MLEANVEEIAGGVIRVSWRLALGVSAVGGVRDFAGRPAAEEWLAEFREECAVLQVVPVDPQHGGTLGTEGV
jgi:hypothetical protein